MGMGNVVVYTYNFDSKDGVANPGAIDDRVKATAKFVKKFCVLI